MRRLGGTRRSRAAALAAAALLAALAAAALAFAATGDLGPLGCIDDNDTGADTCFESANGLEGAKAVAVSADGLSVYVAAEDDDAVVRFDRDPATGELTPRDCVADEDTGTDCGRQTEGLAGANAVAISADDNWVYVAGGADDAIVRLKRNLTTGRLIPKDCVQDAQFAPGDCAETADGLNAPAGIAISADDASLYASATASGTVVRFKRRTGSGALVAKDCIDHLGGNECSRTTAGLRGATSVAVSPDDASVYVTGFTDQALVSFERDPANGKLTPRGCIEDTSAAGDCDETAEALEFPRSVVVSADGASVYSASGGDEVVGRYDRDPAGGELTARGCVEDAGTGAGVCSKQAAGLAHGQHLALSPDDDSLYVASFTGVVHLKRNASSGGLIPKGCVESDTNPGTCEQTVDGLSIPSSVAVSPEATSVYATADFEDDAVVGFVRRPGS